MVSYMFERSTCRVMGIVLFIAGVAPLFFEKRYFSILEIIVGFVFVMVAPKIKDRPFPDELKGE